MVLVEAEADGVPAPAYGVLRARPSWVPKTAAPAPAGGAQRPLAEKVVFCGCRSSAMRGCADAVRLRTEVVVLDCTIADPANEFMFYARELFTIVKDALAAKPSQTVRMQLVLPNGGNKIYLHGLSSLLRTMHQESSRLRAQLIIVNDDLTPEAIMGVLEENLASIQDVVVRYDGSERSIQRWIEISPAANAAEPERAALAREGGVYLITGGLGGLGSIVAREIAGCTTRATVILAGRSALTSLGASKIEALAANGAKVAYRQADVACRSDVEHLIDAIVEEHKGLNGIVHAAGFAMDRYIVNKTLDELELVMAPKVAGLGLLDEATRALDLDFFLLFSSMSGARGNAGQSDYAMGNAFMDSFAHHRNQMVAAGTRRGKTLSINWPLWADGGMAVSDRVKEFMKKKLHVVPMPTADGLRIINQVMSGEDSQWIICYGDIPRMRGILF